MKIFNNCCFVVWLCHNKTLNSKIIYMRAFRIVNNDRNQHSNNYNAINSPLFITEIQARAAKIHNTRKGTASNIMNEKNKHLKTPEIT